MAASLIDLFRVLASFSPKRGDNASLRGAPWESYVDWAISQGLAPLAAYNLEYRLGGGAAPEWARDRLLSIYQGTANDNVMKLVGFKRTMDPLEGRKVVVLGGASFAESLYPHVAFRPVIDLRVLVPRGDVEPFVGFLRRGEFKPEPTSRDELRVVSDGRTTLSVHAGLLPPADDAALLSRAVRMKVYGPSAFHLELEDALLTHVLLLARAGFEVPMIELLDLRELVLGAPNQSGPYSRPPDAGLVLERAAEWKVERALWAAVTLCARLFPEAAEAAHVLLPRLLLPTRELLERLVVAPLADPERRSFDGAEALRALLASG